MGKGEPKSVENAELSLHLDAFSGRIDRDHNKLIPIDHHMTAYTPPFHAMLKYPPPWTPSCTLSYHRTHLPRA